MLALLDLANRLEDAQPRATVDSLLDEVSSQEIPAAPFEERGGALGAVRLLTAHRAKGLEWDLVVVAGVQEGVWPDVCRRGTLLDADGLATLTGLREALQPANDCAAIRWSLEILHRGQGSPVEVTWLPEDDLPALQARFAARYEALRGQRPARSDALVGLLRGVFEQPGPQPGGNSHHLRRDPALWARRAPTGEGP